MKIKFRDYTLEPEGRNFNLYKLVTIVAEKDTKNQKKGQEYKTDKNMGWSMRFETCIDTIIKDVMNERDVVLELKEYIAEYRSLKEEVLLSVE